MIFNHIAAVAKDLHAETLSLYWILLVPLLAFLIVLELAKDFGETLRPNEVLRRTLISVLLLISFEEVLGVIGFLGDGILNRIDQKNSFVDVISQFGPLPENESDSWFNLREHALYFMCLFAYMIAYLGFFMAEALTHFVWTVLYVLSPLMILAYVPKQTAHVTSNLYRGLIQVIVWKVLWTILGVLLLNLAKEAKYTGFEDYLQSIVLNLCIGFSMLFIPLASKSLVNDGFSSVSSTIATMPAKALSSYLKAKTKAMIPKNLPGLNGPSKNEFRKNQQRKENFEKVKRAVEKPKN